MPVYKIMFTDKGKRKVQYEHVRLNAIGPLAHYLNWLVEAKAKRILITYISNENMDYIKTVKFLNKEYKEQKFITKNEDRLLAVYNSVTKGRK